MMGNYQMWVQHFIDQSKGLIPHQNFFYKIAFNGQKGDGKTAIQVVTPTEQVVARAKATLVAPIKHSYDPVTGVSHQSPQNRRGERITLKRKNPKKSTLHKSKKTNKKVIKKKKKTSNKKQVKKTSKKELKSWLL